VGGKDPDGVLACENICGDKAFHTGDLIFLRISYKKGIHKRIPGKNDHAILV
jgi:hypothetical protein